MTTDLLIILNLFLIESLLSVDNAAVLAVLVKDLPYDQKRKALRYGILGAYLFRGLLLFVAAWLIKIIWLKILGGVYLLYLAYGHFSNKVDTLEEIQEPKTTGLYKMAYKLGLSQLLTTIILVEFTDIVFSIDNIFAAVAMSSKFWVIMTGVAIGILAMRIVAGWFVRLMERFPFLTTSAFIVIGLLGIRLIVTGVIDYMPGAINTKLFLESQTFTLLFSGLMMVIFFMPLILREDPKPAP